MIEHTTQDTEEMRDIGAHIAVAIGLLARYQARHPEVCDWRVIELEARLARAGRVATYLRDGTDPEGDAARRALGLTDLFRQD